MSNYTFRSADGRMHIETDTLSEMKHKLKQYRPCTTRFHARAAFQDCFTRGWHLISTSPHVIGPVYEGVLRAY